MLWVYRRGTDFGNADTGALRWKHKAGDFLPIRLAKSPQTSCFCSRFRGRRVRVSEHPFDHEVTVPQHNYKLELHSEFKHAGEVSTSLPRNHDSLSRKQAETKRKQPAIPEIVCYSFRLR
eukprot:630227-Rhodomonas_salina.2